MDDKQLAALQEKLVSSFDDVLGKKLTETLDPMVASRVNSIVERLKIERAMTGRDLTGLTNEQKVAFAQSVKAVAFGIRAKANEALIEENDSRGGYLVPQDVANAILRIAASVGLVMNQAQQWPMSSDELRIPSYRGSFLTGEYLGVDAVGSVTGLSFSSAQLIAKQWQLAFALSKALLQDASPNLADFLLAMAGEALANSVDAQGLNGTGAPFVGILNDSNVNVTTIAGSSFGSYLVIDDSSTLIGSVDKSVRPGSVFIMSDSVWASLRTQKDSAGNYLLPQAGAASNRVLAQYPSGSILQPDGEILGYPVHTSLHMPALADSAVSTKFIIFGNLRAFAYGERGGMELEEHRSGTFAGKEVALAQQRALVYSHRHALVNALPASFAVAKTAAS